MRTAYRIVMVFFLVTMMACFSSYAEAKESEDQARIQAIRFGTLAVVQALPLFVASAKGYFNEQGIQVELIPFNSAMEKDVALTAREISGYFGDMMTPIILNANKIPVRMVATIFDSTGDHRTFAILASADSSGKTLKDLAEAGIAVSSNTIIDYITCKILSLNNVSPKILNPIETKNIPIRLQMLLNGQVPAATLPEPLVTLAEKKGATAVADDAGKRISPTILAFRSEFLGKHPAEVRKFVAAVSKATSFINKNPEDARSIMNRSCRIPKPLQQSFSVPVFPKPQVPEHEQVMDVYHWLRQKKVINKNMVFKDMVSDEYIP